MTDPKNQTRANATGALREKPTDAAPPGCQAEFDPEEAERAGAFVADALSEEDAADSNASLVDVLGEEQPAFLDAAAPSAEIPAFITCANARERFGMAPGETVPEAIARDIERTPPRGHDGAGHDLIAISAADIFRLNLKENYSHIHLSPPGGAGIGAGVFKDEKSAPRAGQPGVKMKQCPVF